MRKLAWWLLVIGGINWGLVGLGGLFNNNWNIVNKIFGSWPSVEWIIYILVGISAIWLLMPKKQMGSPMA